MILRIAVFAPVSGTFDYLPSPTADPGAYPIGSRVLVPFGRGRRVGIVMAHPADSAMRRERLRHVYRQLEAGPVLDNDVLYLTQWAAAYYRHPIGDVIAAALPARLRQPKPIPTRAPAGWRLTAIGANVDATIASRAPRQQFLLDLIRGSRFSAATLAALPFDWRRPLRELERKQWIERRDPVSQALDVISPPTEPMILNAAQAAAVTAIVAARNQFRTFLLHGVTGSGKTEVYLAAAEQVLQSGLQVLILVPEIGLTEQLIRRVESRLGCAVAILHSAIPEQQRLRAWQASSNGTAKVLIGTRSAVWSRCAGLGLIVVDEEHDLSFKQADGLHYSARDTAVVRAQSLNIPIVLGTATPSLESWVNADRGRYQLLLLRERVGQAKQPTARIVDMRHQPIDGGITVTLLKEIETRLARQEQSLLFVNRRGYAPVILCHNCGWSAECPRCSTRMVYHKQAQTLICHHCGRQSAWSGNLGCCDAPTPVAVGAGTERIEETLRRLLPTARITRIDRDAMRGRGRLAKVFAAINRQEYDVLIGTQMIAKGHHFPQVTLVGILDADSRLYSVDFRAAERLAQQIIQVSGRAGRAAKPGIVMIQTHVPHHPLLQVLLAKGYDGFARDALRERRETGQPPYACWALVRAEAIASEAPRRFLEAVAAGAKAADLPGVQSLGPVTAPIERRAGRYRWQLLLTARTRSQLARLLDHLQDYIDGLGENRMVRWSLDVDPQDLS